MGAFRDNVAHSNHAHGFEGSSFDPVGDPNNLENFRSYRNIHSGVSLGWGQGVSITGGLFSDNRNGILVKWTDNIKIAHVQITGVTQLTRTLTASHWQKHCPNHLPVVGLSLPPFLLSPSRSGATVSNVSFSGFDDSPDCAGSMAFTINKDAGHSRGFDYSISFENISVDDSRNVVMNLCPTINQNIKNVLIIDVDSSLDLSGTASGPSSIVCEHPANDGLWGLRC